MSLPPLTPWFPAHVKPARPGVYRVEQDDVCDWYRRWDGAQWFCGGFTPKEAGRNPTPWGDSECRWRGLSREA